MAYAPEDDGPADPGAVELAQELLDRARPLTEGGPPWRYLAEARSLPGHAIHYCAPDLRQLEPPIAGFDQLAYGVVFLLRDKDGDISGFAVEACGPAGERMIGKDGRTARKSFRLRDRGCADGLFQVKAATEGAMVAYLIEGRLAKVLAVAAVIDNAAIYGWGGRPSLGTAIPPEPTVIVIADRRPDDPQEAEQHDQDYQRGCDRLILAGKAVLLAELGGSCKDLDEAIQVHPVDEARDWLIHAEAVQLSLDGHARRIAKLKDPLRRGQAIADVVEQHDLRKRGLTAAFRAEVAKYMGCDPDQDSGDAAAPIGAGTEVVFEEVVPWHDPVDGAALLDELDAALQRHAACDEAERTLAGLWAVHGYRRFHGNVGTLPRLVITAGREDAGKTHLGLCITHLSERGEITPTPTAANVYRSVAVDQPVFQFDETDVWYPRDVSMQEIINSGFNRDGASVRRIEDVGGDGKRQLESRRFSTFTPIALIGNNLEKVLRRTVLSRALIIRMRPARAGDPVEDLYDNAPAVARLKTTARRVKRWVADNEIALSVAVPERPVGVINRLWITWRPLLAIADRAGGEWPVRARAALEVARVGGADPGLGIQLLGDVHQILTDARRDRMHTGDLIGELLKLELRSWSYYGKARSPIRDTDVARLLEPYELHPVQMKISGQNRRGYNLEDVLAAIDRYAPHLLSEGAHPDGFTRYPATNIKNPSDPAEHSGSGPVAGSGQAATENAEKVAGSGQTNPGATGFPEENESGSGVAGKQAPEEGLKEKNTNANGAAADVALECNQCGCTFLHPTGRGRRPKRCPECRGKPRAIRGADTDETVEFLS